MNDAAGLVLALLTGVLLGAVFFGGLWWTIHRLASTKRPALWIFTSLLLRTGLTLAVFYVVARDHWERLLFCLLGFLVARLIVTWLTRLKDKPAWLAEAGSHAP